jgi:hypothetical protein
MTAVSWLWFDAGRYAADISGVAARCRAAASVIRSVGGFTDGVCGTTFVIARDGTTDTWVVVRVVAWVSWVAGGIRTGEASIESSGVLACAVFAIEAKRFAIAIVFAWWHESTCANGAIGM